MTEGCGSTDEIVGKIKAGFGAIKAESSIRGGGVTLDDLVVVEISPCLEAVGSHDLGPIVDHLDGVVDLGGNAGGGAKAVVIEAKLGNSGVCGKYIPQAPGAVPGRVETQGVEGNALASNDGSLIGVVAHVNQTNIIDRVAFERCGKTQIAHQGIADISLGKTRDVHTGVGIDPVEFVLEEVSKGLADAGVYISTDSIFVIA